MRGIKKIYMKNNTDVGEILMSGNPVYLKRINFISMIELEKKDKFAVDPL